MALSGGLARAGTPPSELHVEAEVTFDKVAESWSVVSSRLIVIGHVDDISDSDFEAACETAKDGCPISRALNENVHISVDATLEH
jgi:osmotically inducible protein OsmC